MKSICILTSLLFFDWFSFVCFINHRSLPFVVICVIMVEVICIERWNAQTFDRDR